MKHLGCVHASPAHALQEEVALGVITTHCDLCISKEVWKGTVQVGISQTMTVITLGNVSIKKSKEIISSLTTKYKTY